MVVVVIHKGCCLVCLFCQSLNEWSTDSCDPMAVAVVDFDRILHHPEEWDHHLLSHSERTHCVASDVLLLYFEGNGHSLRHPTDCVRVRHSVWPEAVAAVVVVPPNDCCDGTTPKAAVAVWFHCCDCETAVHFDDSRDVHWSGLHLVVLAVPVVGVETKYLVVHLCFVLVANSRRSNQTCCRTEIPCDRTIP